MHKTKSPMNRMLFHRSKAGGFTLTELAIVLAIIGMILAAIWTSSALVSASSKVQKATDQILLIANGYQSLYAAHGIDVSTNWTDVTCMGASANYFPSYMLRGTCTSVSGNFPQNQATTAIANNYPVSPWGPNTFVWVQVSQSNNMIDIGYANLPQAACNSLASAVSFAPNVVFQNIYQEVTTVVAGVPVNSGNNGGHLITATSPPWTVAQINGYCAAGNVNFIEVGFLAR